MEDDEIGSIVANKACDNADENGGEVACSDADEREHKASTSNHAID